MTLSLQGLNITRSGKRRCLKTRRTEASIGWQDPSRLLSGDLRVRWDMNSSSTESRKTGAGWRCAARYSGSWVMIELTPTVNESKGTKDGVLTT